MSRKETKTSKYLRHVIPEMEVGDAISIDYIVPAKIFYVINDLRVKITTKKVTTFQNNKPYKNLLEITLVGKLPPKKVVSRKEKKINSLTETLKEENKLL